MPNKSDASEQIISLPKGGGALDGIGEKFSPNLFTGTGNFTVPIALLPGRNAFQPQLNLVYSTGNGNGPFGLGWSLSIPGVSRKTSKGVPQYGDADESDVFVLSGAEDLVLVKTDGIRKQYRPRTEGLFAKIERIYDPSQSDDFWEVRSKDGLISTYGATDALGKSDPAAIGRNEKDKFAWKLTETRDTFRNRIVYQYGVDAGDDGAHIWQQPILKSIQYVEYEKGGTIQFLVAVDFEYEKDERPDPFSDYRAGFEVRTTKLCKSIKVSTHPADGNPHFVREYRLTYQSDANNGISLLKQLDIIGYDDEREGTPYADDDPNSVYAKQLPPLTFGYTMFDPRERRFAIVEGRDLPAQALGAADLELVDLHGSGLPDILEMNGTVRYWRNLGNGHFDLPRPMHEAPPHSLADSGVQMIDANGDGRMDLLVTSGLPIDQVLSADTWRELGPELLPGLHRAAQIQPRGS